MVSEILFQLFLQQQQQNQQQQQQQNIRTSSNISWLLQAIIHSRLLARLVGYLYSRI